jgi:pimeloyl-ACP methyl ester carboxylesterase
LKRAYVHTRHGQIHYVEAGEGAPLLLIASAGRSARVYDGLIKLLSPDFRVIAIDMIGSGNSDPIPPGSTIETFAETAIGVLDELGIEKAHVYGFNLGNKIGTAMAAGWPSRVDRLMLAGQSHSLIPTRAKRDTTIHGNVNANFPDEGASDVQNRLKLWSTAFRRVMDFWWDESLFAGAIDPQVFEQARQAVIDRVQSQNSVVAIYQAVLSYDLEAGLKKIGAKTLIVEAVTPSEDGQIGRQGEALLKIIPGSRVVEIKARDLAKHAVTLIEHYPELAGHIRSFCLEKAA